MSILTWNCNSLTETKRSDIEFCDIINENDIIFLLESWTNSKSKLDFEGYRTINFYRKYQHRRARRSSGGVVLLYKEELKDGITIVKNRFDTLIWIKLDRNFFQVESDIYVCGA